MEVKLGSCDSQPVPVVIRRQPPANAAITRRQPLPDSRREPTPLSREPPPVRRYQLGNGPIITTIATVAVVVVAVGSYYLLSGIASLDI